MIRNKLPYLIAMKSRRRTGKYTHTQMRNQLQPQPHWFEEYYREKEILKQIHQNNINIQMLAKQYQHDPTVYALKQVERLISQNCKFIDDVDRWVSGFKLSPASEVGIRKTEQSILKHFQAELSQQILSVFNSKQIITSVNNEIDHQNSFSLTSPHVNQSRMSNNSRSFTGEPQDRDKLFEQVNFKIENLNIVYRKMNALVAAQGDLVNRIDQNLASGQDHIVKANEQLKNRVDMEEGNEEFSFEGKINQAITGLYIVNLVLIAIFFIKNVFF